MGIRLKTLISLFILLGVYAIYYCVLPKVVNLDYFNPLITKYIKSEYNFNVKIENPNFKTALSPAIWLKADKFSILNDDGSSAFYVEKPLVKVSILPLIIGRLDVKYFNCNKIFADVYYDKSLRLKLGQYLIMKTSNFIINLDGGSVFVDKFDIDFTNSDDNSKIKLCGNYFNIDKYIENKVLKTSLDASLLTDKTTSHIAFNLDTKLPFAQNLEKYPPEIAASVTNLELTEYSNLIKTLTNGDISMLSGIINVDIHSDKKIMGQKQYITNFVAENIKCSSKYLQKPYSYPSKIQLKSHLLLEKNRLNIPSISFEVPKFGVKLSGSIDKVSSKKPVPDLDLKIFNARAKDILDLIPYSNELDKLIKINVSVAKESNFNSDVNVNLKIKDNLTEPLMYGKIIVDNAYVYEPIKKAPKGAYIGIEYKGDYLNLDVNVPTEPTQEVNVKGRINAYGEQKCDLHITSTPLIDLTLTKKVLIPVHRTFNFMIGPVPVMEFAGFGSIDLVVKGTKKDPHTFGWFKALNATTYFDDVHNLVLKNANAILKFEDFDTKFSLLNGTVNGKPVSIDGTCNLAGKFDFKVSMQKQELNNLLKILKTSPMLEPVQKSVKMIESTTGLADFTLNLKGQLLDISDIDLGKNVHAKGDINLVSNSIKLSGLLVPLQNVSGKLSYNDFDFKLNLISKISNAKVFISGVINDSKVALSFNSEKIRIAEALRRFAPSMFIVQNFSDSNEASFAQFKGEYHGEIDKIDYSKIKLSGSANFKNLNLIYRKTKMPVRLISGNIVIKDGVLDIKTLNTQIGTMPATIYGFVGNFLQKPKLNLSINAKPNQKFVDYVYNKNVIYPVKIRGNVSLNTAISGFLDNLSLNSIIKIEKGSSIYYMGATIGDEIYPIHLSSNTVFKPNQLNVKSFIYDKIAYTNRRIVRERQLSANGQLSYTKNDIYFKNFRVKTNVHTDMRIFNIVFKKPLIKKGIFTSDILVNGSFANPIIRGDFNIFNMDIPFFDANVENLSLKFWDNKLMASIQGSILNNKFILDINAKNSLKPPFVINSATFDIGNFNVDHVIDLLNKMEINSSREVSTGSNDVMQVNFNEFIINNLEILANSIDFNNINARDLVANISVKNGNLSLDKFKFKLAKGVMEGSGGINLNSRKSNFDLSVSNADADRLLSSILDVRGQLYGDLSGQISLSCTGVEQADCLKSLNGHGAFLIKNGRMPKLGSLEYLLKAGNLLKSGITGLSINGIVDLITPLKTGNFSSIKGSIAIHDGVADKIQILSTGKDLSIFVTGDYNFSNYIAKMYVFGRLSKKISTVLGPVGNVSLNTLFSAIPGVNLNDPSNARILNDLNKIPMIELSNKAYRVFAVEVFGNINGEDYVQSFRWVE